jgi:hypothetical protein
MENFDQETDITLEHSTSVEKQIQEKINYYYYQDQEQINLRLLQLDNEMDLETYLQTETSAVNIAGLILALTSGKKWLILPFISSLFVLSNLMRGDKPPLTFLRKLGLRRRAEIEKERYALKAIRGDFKTLMDVPNAVWNAVNK